MIYRCLILLTLFVSPAWANDIVVRGGEHGDFTRIVLSTSSDIDWTVSETARGYLIETSQTSTFDTSKVYERISNSRVSRQEVTDSALEIITGCDCGARSFALAGGGIAIDFSETFSRETSTMAEPTFQEFDTSERESTFKILDWKGHSGAIRSDAKNWHADLFVSNKDMVETAPSLKSALAGEIGIAATAGLLSPIHHKSLPNNLEEGVFAPEIFSDLKAETQVQIGEDAQISLSVDLNTKPACAANPRFQISNWGTPDNIYGSISAARLRLVNEADEVDQSRFMDLIQATLYAGFGVEARLLLEEFPDQLEYRGLFLAMAELLDSQELGISDASLLRADSDEACVEELGLWKKLSQMEVAGSEKPILAEFSGLPQHLREQIGPRLLQAYIEDGDLEAAGLIKVAIERGSVGSNPKMYESYAKLEEIAGNTEGAEELYNDVLRHEDEAVINAAPKYVQLVSQRRGQIPPETTELIDAVAFQHQGTIEGRLLNGALVKSLILNGDLNQALIELQSRDLDTDETYEIDQLIVSTIENNQNSAIYIGIYADNPEYFQSSARPENLKILISNILYDAGFKNQAEKVHSRQNLDAVEVEQLTSHSTISNAPLQDIELSDNLVEAGKLRIDRSAATRANVLERLSQIQ